MATYHNHQCKGKRFRIRVAALVGGSATGGFDAQPFEILNNTEVEFGAPLAESTAKKALARARKAIDKACEA